MSWPLFKTMTRHNWVLWAIFYSVTAMYLVIMVYMFSPDDMTLLASMLDLFPEDLMKALGFSKAILNMTDYLASWLYGLLMLGFPMVYCIILGNRLVAKMVDDSSFAYLLSTPNSRVRIVVTQGTYALVSLLVMFAATFGTGVVISELVFPGELDIRGFFWLNMTTMLVNMVVIMISFFFSCLFNDSKGSLAFGSGLPILFLMMHMMGGVSEQTEVLKKFSIFGLYDPVDVARAGQYVAANSAYLAIIVVLFAGGVWIFRKKQLPI